MARELVHIWGPISIQGFGLFVAAGILTFAWLVYNHKNRKKLITNQQASQLLFIGVLSGILGGRLLYVLEEYKSMSGMVQMLSIWEGGSSILGVIIGIVVAITIYLRIKKIPILPFLDLLAIYAPLAQSISRIGCFVAGCCYGMPSTLPWAVQAPASEAFPICMRIHPTQLYSSLALLFIFLFMRFVATRFCSKPGQLITLYLVLASMERFTVDFWRADRTFFGKTHPELRPEHAEGLVEGACLSIHQWLALGIALVAIITFIGITVRGNARKK